MMKKAKALIECFSFNQKERREKMKVVYSFDTRNLIDEDNNRIATITKEGLIYLSPLYVSMKNFKDVKKFIEDYKPLGFYDKESERIYYKKRNEEESTK